MADQLPILDMAPLFDHSDDRGRSAVGDAIAAACEAQGFFYLVGHRIAPELFDELEPQSRRFFALSVDEKMAIAMERGGRAWRGYFPIGGELTSGRPDLKEGLNLGTELGPDHPRVREPLAHGGPGAGRRGAGIYDSRHAARVASALLSQTEDFPRSRGGKAGHFTG